MKKIYLILLLFFSISHSLKAQDDPELLGTWYLHYFETNGNATYAPLMTSNPLRIIFESTTSTSPAVNGTSTCNGFFFDYQVDLPNNTITTILFAQTLATCGPDVFEPAYLYLLGTNGNDTFNYSIDFQYDTLTLTDASGGKIVYGRSILSVQDNEAFSNSIQLYPNPAQKELFINGIPANSKAIYTIYDVIGSVIIPEKKLTENNINVQSLKAGIYFLKISKDGKTAIKKFIKQ